MRLRPEQVLFYEFGGFLIVRELFAKGECQQLIRLIKGKADLNFKTVMNPDREIPEVKTLIRDGLIADVVEGLHSFLPMDYLMTQSIIKQPGTPFEKHAWNNHQDNDYTRHPENMGATAIIALEDSDRENGTLYLYPGSHKLGLIPHKPGESFNPDQTPGNRCEVPEEFKNKKFDLIMEQGDLYIQHGSLIHGSYPNTSGNRSRTHLGISCIVRGQPFRQGKNSQR